MDEEALFPSYIRRDEEEQIRREVAQIFEDGNSRAVLLYGRGGIGKTWMVRELAKRYNGDQATVWLKPIDVDDSEYWLLSNLEREIAQQLDPENEYFGEYIRYLSELPSFTRSDISHETVVSHLGRIKQAFVQSYRAFVRGTSKTVVIAFDTVETIRGMYLQVTLTQWMKALPGTLFILAGRPPPESEEEDPIQRELEDPHSKIPVRVVRLTEFTHEAALAYLNASSIAGRLSAEEHEPEKLVLLTRGHPLWLAFAIAYLRDKGVPQELTTPIEEIQANIPYRGEMTSAGLNLHEDFKRRLVTPYREADFWHEAIKRLAVVRQSVDEPIWRRLMVDHPLPDGVLLEQTWELLQREPWIRPRANGRFVTLHDAVAEELAERIIPLHDQDGHWRHELWERAVKIYADLTEGPEHDLNTELAEVDEALRGLGPTLRHGPDDREPSADISALIREVALLDARNRALDQLKAARLFYQLLSDPNTGCEQFLTLFATASLEHDVLFEVLLALEMQRFLPGGAHAHVLGDVIGDEIDKFRRWLTDNPGRYVEVCLAMAQYFIEERPQEAMDFIDQLDLLPDGVPDYSQRYRMNIVRGNACMRIPGRVRDGLPYFERALAEAQTVPDADKPMLVARAYKELGFYHRNQGRWTEADTAYQLARNAILPTLTTRSSDDDREEMASIQTQWAYVKGLVGSYREGSNLVESAIAVRRRLKRRQQEGLSWSVCGEVYRYERRFHKSWEAFERAEQIFLELRKWSWLGVVYQEQAICIYQALQDGIDLLPGRDNMEHAKDLALRALDLCRDQSVRNYPSALNRAGRIFGHDDYDTGIAYLAEGIRTARDISDGWFLLANLIEYVEGNYRAWAGTGDTSYLHAITTREPQVLEALAEYDFPDLKGRWNLLQGHLAIRRWQEDGETTALDEALSNYKVGFSLIAQGFVGSSGAAAIPSEFERFGKLLDKLPDEVRAEWQEELRREWSEIGQGTTLVLARLEELY
jgi:tetratricopeptide (TPR) repeat protein